MGVETEIKGSPAQVRTAATFLSTTMADALDEAKDEILTARREALGGWREDAGESFVESARRARVETEDLADGVGTVGRDLERFAGDLRRCQDGMAEVRRTAGARGLVVSGFVVQDPGPGSERPGPTIVHSPAEAAAHDARIAEYDAHQDKIRAYNEAADEAGRLARSFEDACDTLTSSYDALDQAGWVVPVAGEVFGAVTSDLLRRHASALQGTADEYARQVETARARLGEIFDNEIGSRQELDRRAQDLTDAQERHGHAAQRAGQAADDFPRARLLGRALGPVGLGLGIFSDLGDGETPTQAVVSQAGGAAIGAGAGVLAAAGTGAAMGAMFGSVVPGAGTAVGAVVGGVVGIGVGIFSDGAIDSLFENGPDVGAAVDSGLDALADTGEAIADGVGWVVDGIGGLFS